MNPCKGFLSSPLPKRECLWSGWNEEGAPDRGWPNCCRNFMNPHHSASAHPTTTTHVLQKVGKRSGRNPVANNQKREMAPTGRDAHVSERTSRSPQNWQGARKRAGMKEELLCHERLEVRAASDRQIPASQGLIRWYKLVLLILN